MKTKIAIVNKKKSDNASKALNPEAPKITKMLTNKTVKRLRDENKGNAPDRYTEQRIIMPLETSNTAIIKKAAEVVKALPPRYVVIRSPNAAAEIDKKNRFLKRRL